MNTSTEDLSSTQGSTVGLESLSLSSTTEQIPEEKSSQKPIIHDDMYYKATGDCVVQVEDVLFKIHKERLASDDSAFEAMFSLPSGAQDAPQGSSDENPIVCHDTVGHFQILCWALYATPLEIFVQPEDVANIYRLVELAAISNKYHFTSYESWAWVVITQFVRSKRGQAYIGPFLDRRIVEVSLLCKREELTGYALSNWYAKALRDEGKGASQLSEMLETCEAHGLRDHQVKIYHHFTQQICRKNSPITSLKEPFSVPSLALSSVHLLRVLTGYAMISTLFENLKAEGSPKFESSPSCSIIKHFKCIDWWTAVWNRHVKDASLDMTLGFLDSVIKYCTSEQDISDDGALSGTTTRPSPECKKAATEVIRKMQREFEETLPNYFFAADQ